MIKTASIFPDRAARNSSPILAAMRRALADRGIQIKENSLDADAVIIWSVLWAGRMSANQPVYETYRTTDRPVIVVDIGTLIRGVTWKIALGNINGQGWFGEDDTLDTDRPKKLGIGLGTARPASEILIALQHRHSLQAQAIPDMRTWVQDRIREARVHTDRPIVIRPHPRDPLRFDQLPQGARIQQPRPISGTYDAFDWTDHWHAVINHNSGPGVLAALAGIRPVVDQSSMAWPVSVNISAIESPYEVNRDQWLISLANTEYTEDEIAQGLWLKRLSSRL